MKRIILMLVITFHAMTIMAQAPELFSYQAVVRDSKGNLLAGNRVSFSITILSGSTTGTVVYREVHDGVLTDEFGLVDLLIGNGKPQSGSFGDIRWGENKYFIQVAIDPLGGWDYETVSITQLLSVPYALHSKMAYTADYENLTNRPVLNIANWNTAFSWGNHALAGYVPQSRLLNINGDAYDLSVNRKWNVGTVTSVGLALPDIFEVTNTPVIQNGTLTATWAQQNINQVFASPAIGKGGAPSFRHLVSNDIPALSWNKITSDKPTTLAGYGITDAATTAAVNTLTEKVNTLMQDVGALSDQIELLKSIAGVGSVTDVDGNEYKTITIGSQVWMAENLKTTRYKDGSDIPLVTDGTAWSGLSTGAYCWIYNNAGYKDTYGALYNWYAVNTGALCPAGWHVPSDAEWTKLIDFLYNNGYGYEGSGGDIAKSVASASGWASSSTPGTPGNDQASNNSSGFSGLPGGSRRDSGYFPGSGADAYWWSSTVNTSTTEAWYYYLYYHQTGLYRDDNLKRYGYSVRCVRN